MFVSTFTDEINNYKAAIGRVFCNKSVFRTPEFRFAPRGKSAARIGGWMLLPPVITYNVLYVYMPIYINAAGTLSGLLTMCMLIAGKNVDTRTRRN